MARQETALAAFNRGIVSPFGLARAEVKRIALSAETQTNWMPRVLGSMSLRPGLGFMGNTASNHKARLVPFIYATFDTAILEFTDSTMRVWRQDALVTRVAVGTTIPALSGWTDDDEVGGASSWTGTYLQFIGDGTNAAIRDQQITVAGGDMNKEHALRIEITRGPVYLRVGTSSGDDSYINETALNVGMHSLTLTPTGNFWIRFFSRAQPIRWVKSCSIEAAGVLTLPSPFLDADVDNIRFDQTGDIVFIACVGHQQRVIERRGTDSWSIRLYAPVDGPFSFINGGPITLAATFLTGNVMVTASKPFFRSTDVGKLYQHTSVGQAVSITVSGAPPAPGTWSNPIKVTGVGTNRAFTITIAGNAGSTVKLQRSIGDTLSWADVPSGSWAVNGVFNYNDTYDNSIIYYRIGVDFGGYVGGTDIAQLKYNVGSITGVFRVVAFTNTTTVDAEVLTALGGTSATVLWAPGEWSDTDGWPSGVALHEGRCWWSGLSKVWGSISGVFDSFDNTVVGDSGVIDRAILGSVDTIAWMISNQRLIIGTSRAEMSCRSSALDAPLTPTAFLVKPCCTHGSASVQALNFDHSVIFAQRNGNKLYKMDFIFQKYDYEAGDLCSIVPEIGYPGIVRMAIQRQPDTRVICVLSDGTAAVLVMDPTEEVNAWVKLTTNGLFEDVVVMPGDVGQHDDQVYFIVNRTINGSTVRYLEEMAQIADTNGGAVTKLADAYKWIVNAPASATVTGLSHLEGQQVCVWADGIDVGTNPDYTYIYTVSGGQITLAAPATNVVVGIPYVAEFLSMKLGSPTQSIQNVLNHYKNINHIGLVLAYVHPKGLRFGSAPDYLDDMPEQEKSKTVDPNVIRQAYDEQVMEFPGHWDTDTRLYLRAQAPRPCTVLGVDVSMEVT